MRRGFADAFAEVYRGDVEAIRQRTALILSVPALRSRVREQSVSLVRHLEAALVGRGADGGIDVEVAAACCAATVTVAVERWATHGGDLPVLVDQAFASVGELAAGQAR